METDFEEFHQLHSDIRVMKYTTGKVYTRNQSQSSLDDIVRSYSRNNKKVNVWAVRLKSKEQPLIGTCALISNEHKEWEVGYRLMPSFWGMGLATELLLKLEFYCFKTHDINMIVGYTYSENKASIKVLTRCGFEIDRTYKKPGDLRYYKRCTSLR